MKKVFLIFTLFLIQLFAVENNTVLTTEEKQWIKDKKTIKACVHNEMYPFIINNKNGYSGISNGWLKIEIEKQFDYTLFWQIISILFIIVLIIVVAYLKQNKLRQEIQLLNNSLEKKVENEVEKNKKQQLLMLHQSRLAQMGEMISMIAHQWRQPLNNLSIINQTITLKYTRGKLDDKLMDNFKENSKKQIEQMSSTIDDFRNFFKPEKEKVYFCINDVITNSLDIIKPIFSTKNININYHDNSKFHIYGYPNELGQAILNILSNSKDALIYNNIKNKILNIDLKKINDKIYLTISDNGEGIPNNILNKIFDPYFSTKDEKNGTGLGLYMTKIIIEDHMGGKIIVTNSNNSLQKGAIFTIELNISENNA